MAEEGEVENHEAKNKSSEFTWFNAVKEQQLERVKEFVAKGVNVNDEDEVCMLDIVVILILWCSVVSILTIHIAGLNIRVL